MTPLPDDGSLIVLDTNVVSELMRPEPSTDVVDWVDAQPVTHLMITAVTAAELRAGAAVLPPGRRRTRITAHIDALINETFAGAVLPFDSHCTTHYATIVADRRRAGTPITALDAQIAAICRHHQAALATRNHRDFTNTGINVRNPWTPGAD